MIYREHPRKLYYSGLLCLQYVNLVFVVFAVFLSPPVTVSEIYQIKMYKMVIISYLFYESLNLIQLALINWGGGGGIFHSILSYYTLL